ncbi:Serine/threonine-protein kinase PknL [Gemmata obscuriglobus]|uniref:Serine/threonine protein kinase n=1 Tax=Gemmata obscuriglobus TaxID=114 RepID=A0A2Z3GWL7_9BACT|nr:serine/threonine-protein kinase [Gemmata obscuriglobus]AWM35957.1 serine/threonine protein kinase [Gemmata obscuriglobus]QEG31479.1 Serine/threonine-protein kinase PknL [Gemmata obscuriglobus]VTS10821.1 serine threonine protein kinase : Serine/threonine protein kinase OS=Blastopirellula marina DSM 3645 GN=DSM3645_00990 PE=3 SV=1: Pkinase: Response_reg [Gemmata obscuriglobus UQM 2246]
MSVNLDASGIGQLAVRLGLITLDQVRDALDELGDKSAPAADMVRLLERKRQLTPWQGNKLLKGDTDGYVLGGYRLLYKIASGSFGRVYRGDDPRTGQVVAVKVLRNKWTQDKQKVDLFRREGQLGMTIRHANIVSVLAVNQDSKTGQYFIVMEFVEGGNLRDLLQARKKLTPDESLRILEECAQGLAYSNARGLTHRDIKPTNILIAVSTGQAKLVDFGLAEITENSSVHLQRQDDRDDDVAVDRTVDYAGLEKATNQKAGDVRSDIYFLGTVLYECLTGATLMPVTKDRQARMQARRYTDVEDTLRSQGPALGLTPPLLRLLAKMVAFEPAERFQNPTQLVEAIQACRAELAGGAVARGPSGPKTLFVVEQNQKLQDAFRDKFKAAGYRVILTIDPNQALRRYQQQAYHALIIDARTVGREGVTAFNDVLRAADNASMEVAVVLILGEDQTGWRREARTHQHGAVLVDPGVTMKQLLRTLDELTPGDPPTK